MRHRCVEEDVLLMLLWCRSFFRRKEPVRCSRYWMPAVGSGGLDWPQNRCGMSLLWMDFQEQTAWGLFFCLVFLFLLVHCPSSAWSVPKPDFHYSICVDPSGALVVSIWLWISKVADSCTGRNQRRGMIAITFTTPLVRLFHFHQITPICLPTC